MKKLTLASLKSFIKKNQGNLFVKTKRSFDSMSDCVASTKGNWHQPEQGKEIGHGGVYCVGSSRDYLTHFEDAEFIGIEVSNCCGCGLIAIKK